MNDLISQINIRSWSIGDIAIAVVVICAIVGVVIVATRAMGVVIPAWAKTVLWICLIAVVAIVAIRFLMAL